MKVAFVFCCLFLYSCAAIGQSISLDSCYYLAKNHYPLARRYELIARSREYSLDNIARGYLPQVGMNAQASYQSDVTQLPASIPGVPVLNKDQYKMYAEVNQPLYDGGVIRAKKAVQELSSAADVQQLEVELYQVRDRINQLYFGILLLDGQLRQNASVKSDIESGLEKVTARIANGAALRSDGDVLKAELLATDQQATGLQSNRAAFVDMLSLFINRPLDKNAVFTRPPDREADSSIRRPELLVYDYMDKIADARVHLLTAENRPKLGIFLQAGFGRPALNMLSNNFDPFYIAGLQLRFPIAGFYTLKNEKALLGLSKKNADVQRETFLFNTRLVVKQQLAEIAKLESLVKTDNEIIQLRTSIKQAAMAQLENGVINSGDYLREVNAADQAVQNKMLHGIRLLMARFNERHTTGN